jgi:hypothetical protein
MNKATPLQMARLEARADALLNSPEFVASDLLWDILDVAGGLSWLWLPLKETAQQTAVKYIGHPEGWPRARVELATERIRQIQNDPQSCVSFAYLMDRLRRARQGVLRVMDEVSQSDSVPSAVLSRKQFEACNYLLGALALLMTGASTEQINRAKFLRSVRTLLTPPVGRSRDFGISHQSLVALRLKKLGKIIHTIAKTLNPRYEKMTPPERKKERNRWAKRIARAQKRFSHARNPNI